MINKILPPKKLTTRTPWAQAHRKQRPQEKVTIHPKGGEKRK